MLDRNELEQMLDGMVRTGGTTLHLSAAEKPSVRIQGKLVRSQSEPASSEALWELIEQIVPQAQFEQLANGEEVQSLFTSESGVCFRNALMLDEAGPNLVFRRLPPGVPSLEDLNLPDVMPSLTQFRRGLVLVTGFLGAGRSTTLAAMIDSLSRKSSSHIVTVEQPIEYRFTSGSSMVHQREVGRHVDSFVEGVRDAVAQGADVIYVADLSDPATIEAVLDAIERGALVIAGMRAAHVTNAIETLLDVFPGEHRNRVLARLGEALRAVVWQTLLHRSNGAERVPLVEVLVNNQAVRRAVLSRSFHELPELMERGRGLGMQTVDRGLRELLNRKLITQEEALYHALDRDWLFKRGR